MNRGLAKRAVFHGLPEIRYFQSRLAREVRRGEIEIHSFCFLTTHFHLLLRSTRGHLSDAMRRVENSFVRWFNRRNSRDGPLFRARFTSRHVDDDIYRHNVIKYIEDNPVGAGLVEVSEAYPHGSARFGLSGAAPPWFSRGVSDRESLPSDMTAHAKWVIERRLEKRTADDPLDDLVGSANGCVQRWLHRKALLADGTSPRGCFISPEALEKAIAHVRPVEESWRVQPGSRSKSGWRVLHIGLIREVVGLSTTEASLALRVARSTVGNGLSEHRQLLLSDPTYRTHAAEVLLRGLHVTYGKVRGSSLARLSERSSLAR